MKIGVSAYSYSKLIKRGAFTLFDAISHAKETGYDAIEFTTLTPPEGKSARDLAGELGDACGKAGLGVSCYAVSADFLNGLNGGDPGAEAERIKGEVDIARVLGAPMLRHDASWGIKETAPAGCRTYRDAIRLIAPAIREVAEYAARSGIRTMTENHGQFLQESRRVEELVLAVDHPNYGLLVDIGNFLCADEPGLAALPTVMPYAFHVHAKDFLWKSGAQGRPDDSWFPTRAGNYLRGTVLGHGVVSVAQCLAFIKNSAYRGNISLEFEGAEEPLDAIRRGFEFLKAR
jgi:sugar phosphate isomerase/epimerase